LAQRFCPVSYAFAPPKGASVFYRTNGAEDQPQQRNNPSGVENRSKRAGPKNASGPGNDARSNRQQRERASAYPNKKRNRFANRSCTQCQPGLISPRFNLASAPSDDPDKPAGEQRHQRERNNATQQTHPGNSIENHSLEKSVA
jgi:hypothetical protein